MTIAELDQMVKSLSLRGVTKGAPCRCAGRDVPRRWDDVLQLNICPKCRAAAPVKKMSDNAPKPSADKQLADLALQWAEAHKTGYLHAPVSVSQQCPTLTGLYLAEAAQRVQPLGIIRD